MDKNEQDEGQDAHAQSPKKQRTTQDHEHTNSPPAAESRSDHPSLIVKLKIPEHLIFDFGLITEVPTPSPLRPQRPRHDSRDDLSRKLRNIFLTPQERAHNRRPGFCIITSLCQHVDVLLNVVRFLPPRTIINLYSISAPFHYQFNSRYQTFILHATRVWSPSAELIYPWRCYSSLCIKDPALRLPSTHPHTSADIRDLAARAPHPDSPHNLPIKPIPSLRWLSMVVYRSLAIREILAHLLAAALPCPSACIPALSKLWFLMDLPLSAPRVSLIQSRAYFTDRDLWALQLFLLKLEMYFTDPLAFNGGEFEVVHYLLQERGLSPLWDFLRGKDGTRRVDMLRLWVRHGYVPRPRGEGGAPESEEERVAWDRVGEMEVMGVPVGMCGKAGYELYGLGERRLIGPEDLVIRESVRRGLGLEGRIMQMMKWGTMDRHLRPIRKVKLEEVSPSLVLERFFKKRKEREAAWDEEAERAKRLAAERRMREVREMQAMDVD